MVLLDFKTLYCDEYKNNNEVTRENDLKIELYLKSLLLVKLTKNNRLQYSSIHCVETDLR